MPLSELADSNDNKPTRRPTKAWIKKHVENGYFVIVITLLCRIVGGGGQIANFWKKNIKFIQLLEENDLKITPPHFKKS